MLRLPALLKLLSDETRLRILGLLAQEELSVGELARAVAMSQSRVSNHLKLLREAGLLRERREGAYVLVRLRTGEALPEELWQAVEARLDSVEERADDRARLSSVLEERRRRSLEYFDRVAADWDVVGSDFSRGTARLLALARLIPRRLVVADVGCGTGYMSRDLVRFVERVILVDHSEAMLEQARRGLEGAAAELEFRRGELDRLPLSDGEVDAVFANMVMHHVPDLVAALREMRRALRPGGLVVITDLLPHKESWMTEEMADLRLGIDPTDLCRRARRAGLVDLQAETPDDALVVRDPGGRSVELPLFLCVARSPLAAAGPDKDLNASLTRVPEGMSS